jgi:ABC transporter fused permease/ATP-binding protein
MAPTAKDDLPKAKLNKSNLKKAYRLFGYVGRHKWKFFLGMLFLVLTGATALAFPWLMGELIKSAEISSGEINRLGLILLGMFAAQAVFSFFRVVLFVTVTENMLAAIRQDLYNHVVRLPMSFFAQNRVGELNSRFSADLSQIQDTFTSNIAEFLRQLIIITGGVIALFLTSLKLAFLMLAVVPVVAVLAVFFGRYIRKLSKEVQDRIAQSNIIVEETLQGIANVKVFANEMYESLRYGKSTIEIKKKAITGGKARGAFFSFIIFCLFGAIILLVWYSVKMVHAGEMGNGEMVQFILYTVFVGASIAGIAEQYAQIQKGVGATDRVFDLMDQPTEIPEEEIKTADKKLKIHGHVSFVNVAFRYPSRKEMSVLNNVSFTAKAGERIAIVGPSGAGKSTIVSLILRFYDPDEGAILIDGKNIHDYNLHELRNNMAMVPQDVLLFGGTIRENIEYGKPGASQEEIIEAAKNANAYEFIQSFPEKFETVVGERGVKLSGGQRQRIAIARAVLKSPSILLLDEATSSLDSESERLVQEALDKLMIGRTSFIIAHRLSTVRNADKIIVLDKGEIVEIGKHDELIANSGLYAGLSELQFQASV